MQISRLEIFGFKSFMERLVLPLEPGITGVVGPNGCGKSNIVDAIRWVLGETKARSLRGGLLEDVIFNGTDKLRPLGLAEATMTLRSTEKDFFADLTSPELEAELVATADLDPAADDEEGREGDAEAPEGGATQGEAVNQRPKLTVISGSLDKGGAEIEPEAADAAPAVHAAAEERLAAKATLLQRYAWLKSVSEVQITRRLYRSGESEFFINRVPCRLKDVKELFRAVGMGARAYTIVAQGEVGRIVTAKADERRMILEEAAGILGFRDRITAARRRLEETDVNLARLSDIVKEVTRQVNSLRRQAARARNRQALKDDLACLEKALYASRWRELEHAQAAIKVALAAKTDEEKQLAGKLHGDQAQEQAVRSELMSVDLEGDELRLKLDSIKEELGNRARQRNQKASRIRELGSLRAAAVKELERLEEGRSTLLNRREECRRQVEQLSAEAKELRAQVGGLDAGFKTELQEVALRLAQLRTALGAKDREFRQVRERLVSQQSSLALIGEQIKAASPLAHLERAFAGTAKAAFGSDLSSKAELFVDGLVIPAKYVKAVQALVAEKALFLVADEWQDTARNLATSVPSGGGRKGTPAGFGVFAGGESADCEASAVPFPRLLELIEVKEGCRRAAGQLLKNVFVAESLEEALAFFAQGGGRDVSLVTPAGEIVTDFSYQALWHEGGVIQLKSKASELERACAVCTSTAAELTAQHEALGLEVKNAEARQRDLQEQERSRQAEARQLDGRLGQALGRLRGEEQQQVRIEEDLRRAASQTAEINRRIGEYKAEETRVEAEMAAMQTDQEAVLEQEAARLREEYRSLDEGRKEGRKRLSACAQAVEKTRSELDQLREDLSGLELEKQKNDLELGNLRDRISGAYGAAVFEAMLAQDGAAVVLSAEEHARCSDEAAKLRARMLREGDVDPESIGRLEEEQTRLEELVRQRDDLAEAAITLKCTIERLTETSRRRFLSTFEAVRSHFSQLVPRLFGGGRGTLELDNPESPLESGLEIVARPPGKKLKSIELLSGGEKAMCAAALIFAMFIERPSPLCVLDEVDAPLDDANLVRFLGLVKEVSAKTQFVVITHNKNSMSVCDNLIGVTMEEPGASKVLSVSLQEAYSRVA